MELKTSSTGAYSTTTLWAYISYHWFRDLKKKNLLLGVNFKTKF